MWFDRLIRQFFFGIDKIVFNFIPEIYDLLISIARTSVLTQGDIAAMADRIYKLLAIFMIFKVTFSLIMYVVNPDDFSDKNKGISKLGTNIVISLALLILTPYIFSYAYQIQTIILEDNSLATLIFGDNGNDEFLNTAGDDMAYIVISPFFTPNLSLTELYECSEVVVKESDGAVKFNESCSGIGSGDYEGTADKTSMYALTEDGSKFTHTDLKNYVAGVENENLSLMFRKDLATATTTKSEGTGNKESFVMDYKWGISTVVGIVVVVLLINFCMDVALRSIKLAFLQLIAPIPIISYVDPKSGKDGLFKKWYQMCFKTFISLFVRLLALYFAVYIISKVADLKMVDIIDGSYISNGFVAIFIIIGALMFAKQLPKILEGMGIKLDGDGKFTLNPIKKFTDQAIGGKQILGFGAAGLAGGAAAATNLATRAFDKNTWRNKNGKVTAGSIAKGLFKTTGSTVAGGVSATARGAAGASKGEKFGKNFTNSYSGAMKSKHFRDQRHADGVKFTDYWGSKIGSKLGTMSYIEQVKFQDLQKIDREIEERKPKLEHAKEIKRNSDSVKGAKGDFSNLVQKAPDVEKKQLFLDEVERRSLADYMDGKYTNGGKLDEARARARLESDKKRAKSERDLAIKTELQKRINGGDVELNNRIKELLLNANNAGIDLKGKAISIFDDKGKEIEKITLFDNSGKFIGDAETLWKVVGFNSELTTRARDVSAENAETISTLTNEIEEKQKEKSDITLSQEYKEKKAAEDYATKKPS